MSWSDEFNGTAVDTSKWTVGTGARRDATNTSAAVSVSGGALTVKTYTEGGKHYTGWLGSNGKFENCFGYWEARIRYNSSPGMWSAFWLQPYGINNIGDPAGNGTEIDISEHRRQDSGGADMRNKSAINIHWDGYGADHKSVGSTVNNPGVNTASLQGNYHVYGLLWEPDKYTFYIDGKEVWSTTAAISNVRQWIYLTSEVQNGAWAGSVPTAGYGDRNATTTNFSVDYVRFHQRTEQVINPAFTHRTGPWIGSGAASWASVDGRNGGPGVRLNPSTTTASNFEQLVAGLLPNTDYRLIGWGSVGSRSWPDIRFGVRSHGGAEVYQSVTSSGFSQAQVPFTTGPSSTTARVFARVVTQWGDCFADDIEIRRDAQINNAGFENDETRPWSVYGDVLAHDWNTYSRSGTHAFRFNPSSAARGAEQTIHGLRPATSYTFSGWVRTSGQQVRFGVKNHGQAEGSTAFTGSGNTWQRAAHTFTTGASATTATVYAFIPAGTAVSAVDLDDFTLAEALPKPWTAADIGTTGHKGESFARGGRVVLRGSGANVFQTADSFHWISQPAAGDLSLSAKLDSFESTSDLAKAGLMIRASTAADAAHAMIHWLPQGQVEFIWRNASGASASYLWVTDPTPTPPWLRLQRAGNRVTASFSTDGSAWTQVGLPQIIELPPTAIAAAAVCAHDNTTTAVATFSSLLYRGDRDSDGLPDDVETNTGTYLSETNTGTDPDRADTDGDGFTDAAELAAGTQPLVPDQELVWQAGASPGGSGVWDVATSNWRIGTTATVWPGGKSARFGGMAGTVSVASGTGPVTGLSFSIGGYTLQGTSPITFTDGATITLPGSGTTTLAMPLAGESALTINGAGTLRLTGTSSLRGPLTLRSGTLRLDGALARAAVMIDSAAVLAGSGSASSAIVAGKWSISGQTAPFKITGTLDLTGASLEITGNPTGETTVLATYGSLVGTPAFVSGVPDGRTLDLAYQGNSIALVPKPSPFAQWSAGFGLDPTSSGAPSSDPDRDGLANSLEFILGSNPTSAILSPEACLRATRHGNFLRVSHPRNPAAVAAGHRVDIEWATSPAGPWTSAAPEWITVAPGTSSEIVTANIPVPAGSRTCFARLRASWP